MGVFFEIGFLVQNPNIISKTERPRELRFIFYLGRGYIIHVFLDPSGIIGISYLGDN